jgi:natural product precursor
MKKKKICLRGLSEILSERELKNVLGGSGGYWASGACCYAYTPNTTVCITLGQINAVLSVNPNAEIDCCLPNQCCY